MIHTGKVQNGSLSLKLKHLHHRIYVSQHHCFLVIFLYQMSANQKTMIHSRMKSTEVQTLGAIPGRAVGRSEYALMKRVSEKAHAHALIKCTYNGGVRNIARQKTETITRNGRCVPGSLACQTLSEEERVWCKSYTLLVQLVGKCSSVKRSWYCTAQAL